MSDVNDMIRLIAGGLGNATDLTRRRICLEAAALIEQQAARIAELEILHKGADFAAKHNWEGWQQEIGRAEALSAKVAEQAVEIERLKIIAGWDVTPEYFRVLVFAETRERAEAAERDLVEARKLLARSQEELRLIRMKDCGAVYDVTLRLELNQALAQKEPAP